MKRQNTRDRARQKDSIDLDPGGVYLVRLQVVRLWLNHIGLVQSASYEELHGLLDT